MITEQPHDEKRKGALFFENGRMYFSRSTERRVYFMLTVAIAAMGILVKMGLL